jgi:para-nitrobenzyl esterase
MICNKKIKIYKLAAVFVFLQWFALANSAQASPMDCTDIKTAQGIVSGTLNENAGVCSYKGIPYAAPPVGQFRWAMPQEPQPWTGALAADRYRDSCMQKPFSLLGGDESQNYVGSEDCLYLNVWQPASEPKSPRPVMVFLYGGSFLMGAGSWELYDGTRVAALGGVIMVTINYRLGPFAMLAHPALRDADGHEGNYMLFDQIAALKWVRKNIASFGGDPNNVTLFGESAGGMSVVVHVLSPLSRGLFQKAIIESGPPIFMGAPLKTAEDASLKIAAKLGCSDPKTAAGCLRRADAKDVMTASNEALTPHGGTVEVYDLNPVMDDAIVFTNPYLMFAEGKFNKDIKLIVGTNRDEADMSAMSRPLANRDEYEATLLEDVGWAKKGLGLDIDINELKSRYPFDSYKTPKRAYSAIFTDMIYACPSVVNVWQLAANGTTVYQYQLEKSPDEKGFLPDTGVFHAAELPFVFGNFSFMGLNVSSPKNTHLSKAVIGLWTSFARDGVPRAEGIPDWPPYTPSNPAYLRIDVKAAIGYDLRKDACTYFDAAYAKTYAK